MSRKYFLLIVAILGFAFGSLMLFATGMAAT